jgi:electron transfer flavoprotein alpha subunit
MPHVFAYILHKAGAVDDSAAELLAAARSVDPACSPIAIVFGSAEDVKTVTPAVCDLYSQVWAVVGDRFTYPNAELIRNGLLKIVPEGSFLLASHEHFGIDLCPGLSIKLNAAFVSDVLAIDRSSGDRLTVVRQEFGGQVNAHVQCDVSHGAVITIRPGAFKPLAGHPASGKVTDKSSDIGTVTCKRRYLETLAAEAGDVDITKHSVLVSVGRGIQEKENIAIAQDLADAMDAAVSCSRPVVDAKWLDKSRQVGSSGKTVKPKVYLACGISGAFQHLVGLKGSPFIIAINKNPKAPIFQIADIGIVDDLLEFLPELTNKIREMHSVPAK